MSDNFIEFALAVFTKAVSDFSLDSAARASDVRVAQEDEIRDDVATNFAKSTPDPERWQRGRSQVRAHRHFVEPGKTMPNPVVPDFRTRPGTRG